MIGSIGIDFSTYYQTLNVREETFNQLGDVHKKYVGLSGSWFGKQIRQSEINR